MNEQPDPADTGDDIADKHPVTDPASRRRAAADPDQLAFLTRHMGRVIGADEWGAALGTAANRPSEQPLERPPERLDDQTDG